MGTVLDTSSRTMGSPCKLDHPLNGSVLTFSSVASSKHLQTRRFLDTLKQYFHDVQRMIIQLHRQANERPRPLEPTSPSHGRKSSRSAKDQMKPLDEEKTKIVVKRAGSQLLVTNKADADEGDGDEVDLDLLSTYLKF